jgi:twinkle protein
MSDESICVAKESCPKCGSRDNLGRYSDGHAYCFGCGYYEHGDGEGAEHHVTKEAEGVDFLRGEVSGLPARQISAATCQFFGYFKSEYRGRKCQVANYYAPDGMLVGQKLRFADKTFKVLGDVTKKALPFGAHKWSRAGKRIIVTEGEIDALSVSQIQGNKWPVVSIASGAGPQVRKNIGAMREYLLGFDQVVLCFDNDTVGTLAAQTAAEVIGPTALITRLPLKDANEMLVAGRAEELVNAMWRADRYRPDGIVVPTSLREQVLNGPKIGVPWPWEALTKQTYGRRRGEIITVGAGTGIGKTTVLLQIAEHAITQQNEKVGLFFLEASPADTLLRLAGMHARKTFHIPDGTWTQPELEGALDALELDDKVFLFESFGAVKWDQIEERMRYLANVEDVRFFVLDNLTALAAAEEDERLGLDRIMAALGGLVTELEVSLLLVTHLSRPDGKSKSHEEGGRVMLRHLRGSNAVAMWSSLVYGLERDQQSEQHSDITIVRCLKDRFTGRATGKKFGLHYEHDTGLLVECAIPEEGDTRGKAFDDESNGDY